MSLTGQIYEQCQAEFIERCQQVEEGNLSALDCAVEFKQEMDFLNALSDQRKAWLNENVDEVVNEAEQYGKEGYHGLIFSKQVKSTPSWKNVPAWVALDKAKKDFETKSKLAFKMVEKGGLNVDENGEVIPLPEFSHSSYIKAEKVRK